jgi:XTP/dITP diphosphohydrolase
MFPKSLILATHNTGKIAEFKGYFEGFGTEIITAKELNLSEPDEIAGTFIGNARIKAEYIFETTNNAALADDSGLCINHLNGAPGVDSAYYGGDHNFDVAMDRVLSELDSVTDRSAYFISVLVMILNDGTEIIAEGRVNGMITTEKRGVNGFGYDPIFIPEGALKTFAEMTADEKKLYSHRARAFDQLIISLKG